jgi:hypothetical protein
MQSAPFITTSTGIVVSLLEPKPEMIELRDIAHQLATINRFCGAALNPLSYAQHSVFLAELLEFYSPRHAVLGLLYCAPVAYLESMGDPNKEALFGRTGFATDRDEREEEFHHAIRRRFGIAPPSAKEREAIGVYDEVAFVTEWRDLMPPDAPCPKAAPAHKRAIKAWPWSLAEEKYILAFRRLAVLTGAKGAA